jgi:gliding motility-associated-like protein
MKKILLAFFLLLSLSDAFATHTKGGWMYYEYLGPGVNDPSKLRYKIGLKFYVDCPSNVAETGWNFSIFNNIAPYTLVQDESVSVGTTETIDGCVLAACYPCISPIPNRCYRVSTWEKIVELAPSANGYIISKQRCCRINGITNVSAPSNNTGATYTIKIPGSAIGLNAQQNTSPKFIFNDTTVICAGNPFSLSFQATDINGDSLAYAFCDAYTGGSQASPNPSTSSNPPFPPLAYQSPYNGSQPLGSAVTINPATGTISGIAPPIGEYVVCVCVTEYREGVAIAESRKELHLKTGNCNPLSPHINVKPITCDGFNVTFQNDVLNPSGTIYSWNFGDPASGALNTSNLQNPTHIYTDTGRYNVKLIVSLNGQCTDSQTVNIGVYPGFHTGFIANAPFCKNVPIQFNDTSHSDYGIIDGWSWDFGDLSTFADTSHARNPIYTYTSATTYDVTFIVSSSKGCVDTIHRQITILDKPPLSVFPHDTSYCALDTLQITATGTGIFTWTPNINILGANTATPLVYPSSLIKYYVTLNDNGCIGTDSVTVNPINNLTSSITGPGSMCEEDTIQLNATANHSPITWQWSNPSTLSAPNAASTQAYPTTTTTYTLTARWGNNCVVTPVKTVTVKPLANANAGPDRSICAGQGTAALSASGGNTYTWSPTTNLSNPNIPNPVATPPITTTYTVAVGVTGCSKTRKDSMVVTVSPLPSLSVTHDTLICTIDTLQLTGNGVGNFVWSPNYMIDNVNNQNPLVSPDIPTLYRVILTDANGCTKKDSVFVDVKAFVTLQIGPDTAICKTDGFILRNNSDALHYIWSPSTYLDDPTKKQPFAKPLTTIKYHVIGNIGKCQSQADINVKVVPYPSANAGKDTAVCFSTNGFLHASGGTNYLWTPATFLSNRFIADPIVIAPFATIRYIVTVTDTLGCPKPGYDTVWVTVYPRVIADAGPADTSVVEGEPLLLHGTGGPTGSTYLWDPGTWLTSTTIATPVSLPLDNIKYHLLVTSPAGCKGTDSINVRLYKLTESIYVPNAFTPNGDKNNDVLRPIIIGMKRLNYFKVFNRWGQLVFSTSDPEYGWDGTFGGKPQDPAAYVWVAEGVTYKNVVINRKGSAVLIR